MPAVQVESVQMFVNHEVGTRRVYRIRSWFFGTEEIHALENAETGDKVRLVMHSEDGGGRLSSWSDGEDTALGATLLHNRQSGALLAEFCDDQVTASAEGGEEQFWREWELELKSGADTAVFDRLTNRLRRRFGLRYWSLAEYLKRQSDAAERYIARFVQAGLDDARRRGLDGIVCGHIHRAGLFERDGLVYANDGDWVESLTALAEDHDGSLRLLDPAGRSLAWLPPRAPQARAA